MLATFFVAMLDNMWKGRFMAVMLIIMHANGVYCPWAYTIYANWECRGSSADEVQTCDTGDSRNAPLDPAGLYQKLGCGAAENLFATTVTTNGTVNGAAHPPRHRNCTTPHELRFMEAYAAAGGSLGDTELENPLWCAPIPDNVVRRAPAFAAE